jgi:uncharacterized membrane protein YfcA
MFLGDAGIFQLCQLDLIHSLVPLCLCLSGISTFVSKRSQKKKKKKKKRKWKGRMDQLLQQGRGAHLLCAFKLCQFFGSDTPPVEGLDASLYGA